MLFREGVMLNQTKRNLKHWTRPTMAIRSVARCYSIKMHKQAGLVLVFAMVLSI